MSQSFEDILASLAATERQIAATRVRYAESQEWMKASDERFDEMMVKAQYQLSDIKSHIDEPFTTIMQQSTDLQRQIAELVEPLPEHVPEHSEPSHEPTPVQTPTKDYIGWKDRQYKLWLY